MTFTQRIKKEISILPINLHDDKSELIAILRLNGFYALGNKKWKNKFEIQTQNPAVAVRTYKLLEKIYNPDIKIDIQKNSKIQKEGSHRYVLIVSNKSVDFILHDLSIKPFFEQSMIPKKFLTSSKQKKSFLRGAFLISGSMNDPISKDYHLEISSSNEAIIGKISGIINSSPFNLDSKLIYRRNKRVVYIKASEQISDFLSLIGATNSMLSFEDFRIIADMRNSANRLVNADSANASRMSKAANKQLIAMKVLKNKGILKQLPIKLKKVATLRLNNPDSSLKELSKLTGYKITKSGVNHRMRKLMKIAGSSQKKFDLS